MAQHEVDLIGQAIAATEKEVFNAGFDRDDEDPVQDDTGDRSNEQMGEGLEGQHEPDDDEFDSEDEQSEAAEDPSEAEQGDGDQQEGEGEQEVEGEEEAEGEEETEPEAEAKPEETKPQGRVPSGRLREQTERAEKAERELTALRAEREQDRNSYRAEMDAVRRQVEALTQQRPTSPAPTPQAEQPPDLFENPQGFVDWQNRRFDTALSQRDQMIANMRVENSLAIAHAMHKDGFTKAFEAANKLNVQNPEDRAVVQRIYTAANPGEALVQWHKRNEVLRMVGDDPEKYEQAVASKVKNDPEYRRQFLEELRAEASGQRPNKPANTITRLPKSLNGAAGQSSHGRDATDAGLYDDSDSAVFNSAWR